METSGTRQVVDGRLPDSCQSRLIKSVIEMSREAAQEKKAEKENKRERKAGKTFRPNQIFAWQDSTQHSGEKRRGEEGGLQTSI